MIAGAASPNEHSASNLILRMVELTLIEAVASRQVIREVERNLQAKLPQALPAFQVIAGRCLRVVEDPDSSELKEFQGLANPSDLPILAAALREGCELLATFNVRHYQPGHPSVTVLRLGQLVGRIRSLLAHLGR